jgi:hypothetical protein
MSLRGKYSYIMTENVKSRNQDNEKYLEMYVDNDGSLRDEADDEEGVKLEFAN